MHHILYYYINFKKCLHFFKFYESIDTINIRREISTNPYKTVVGGSGPVEYFLS